MSERELHQQEQVDLKITPLTMVLALVAHIAILVNWWENGDYSKRNGIAQ